MTDIVLTFQPGDHVPSWLVDAEPRPDVPPGTAAYAPLVFQRPGKVEKLGDGYVIHIVGRGLVMDAPGLKYCQIVYDAPITWPDGTVWRPTAFCTQEWSPRRFWKQRRALAQAMRWATSFRGVCVMSGVAFCAVFWAVMVGIALRVMDVN